MPDYGVQHGVQQAGRGPAAPPPQGLNPRLSLVRDTLADCEKVLCEIRARLGIPEPPSSAEKRPEEQNTASGVTMDLLARSARVLELLRSTGNEIA